MPFICSLCGIEIGVGEAMVPNIRMEVAHDRCVQKEILTKTPEAPSDVVIPVQRDPKPIEVKVKISGPGFGNPTASLEPCLPPSRPVDRCPMCFAVLGPVLKGAYAHFPDSRFCGRCVRFIEEKESKIEIAAAGAPAEATVSASKLKSSSRPVAPSNEKSASHKKATKGRG